MKNPYRFTRALIVLLAVSLGACTFDWRRNKDTGTAVRGSLEVPPDLARPGGPETLPPVAPRATAPAATPSTPPSATPAPVAVEPAAPGGRVRLERDGGLRWLVVRDDLPRVWQQLRDYYVRNEIKLVIDDTVNFTLETDWVDRPVKLGDGFLSGLFSKLHSSGLRDKYRVRLERGRVPDTVEVYVSHQGLELIVTESIGVNVMQTAWLPRAADPHAEAEMVSRLMTHFGGDGKQALLAESAATNPAQRVEGEILLANEDLDGAWRRVGLALDRGGVIIEDRDRAAGIYYVKFKASGRKPEKQRFFDWLSTDRSENKDAEVPVDRFQVALKADTAGTKVSVRDVRGEPAVSAAGEELLNLLNQQLR